MGKTKLIISLILMTGLLHGIAYAEEDALPNWKEETLTGDWEGLRSKLYARGVDLQFTHKSDVMANVSGGIKRGTVWMGHTEAQVTLDLDKLVGWSSTTAFIHYHSGLGGKLNTQYVGGFVGEDNIEVTTNTAQFYQAWLQKSFLDDRFSLLVGLYAMDTEFYVTESSGVFIQAPYGMANEIAQSGVNGPPVFPMGALAVRARLSSADQQFYVQGALMDGVPGDPDNPRGTHIKLGDGDGTLSIVEFGYTPKMELPLPKHTESDQGDVSINHMNKTAIGLWRYSHHFDDLTATDSLGNPKRRHSQGVYVLAERTLFLEKAHPSQGLTAFLRFGVADKDVHQADWSGSVGLHYLGLIDGRDDDVAGVAATVNHASDKYKKLNDAVSPEVDVELTYQAQVKPWLAVQPTLQYIANPGMDRTLRDATVIGFRTEITF